MKSLWFFYFNLLTWWKKMNIMKWISAHLIPLLGNLYSLHPYLLPFSLSTPPFFVSCLFLPSVYFASTHGIQFASFFIYLITDSGDSPCEWALYLLRLSLLVWHMMWIFFWVCPLLFNVAWLCVWGGHIKLFCFAYSQISFWLPLLLCWQIFSPPKISNCSCAICCVLFFFLLLRL